MYMVMLILANPSHLERVLRAWREAGVPGVTAAETFGGYGQLARGKIPARYAYGGTATGPERPNFTLWAIVPDEDTVQRCLAAAEQIVGDLDEPGNGVLAAWPLPIVKGVPPPPTSREDR
jgi:hypothetical protein